MPYSFGEELLIDLQQIIPTPEAADYMIGMADKESEEKASQRTLTQTQKLRQAVLGEDVGGTPRPWRISV